MLAFLKNTISEHQAVVDELDFATNQITTFKNLYDLDGKALAGVFGVSLYCAKDEGVLTIEDARELRRSIVAAIDSYRTHQNKITTKAMNWLINLRKKK